MFFYLLLLFIAVPIVELMLLLRIGRVIGAPATILLVIVTGIVGAALARREGVRTLRRIHEQVGRGQVPGDAMVEAVMILMAGMMLLTPGVMTDALGLALLVRPIRRRIAASTLAHLRRRAGVWRVEGTTPRPRRRVVDATVRRVEDDGNP
jgi:UPF0716 protein FxsA